MHKTFEINENRVLFKVEENGTTITNITILNITGTSVQRIQGATISNGNYVKLQASPTIGSTLLVLYSIYTAPTNLELIQQIVNDIQILKEALKSRITSEELNLYVEKLRTFSS